MLRQVCVNAHQHLHLEGKVDPVWLILEALVFLTLHELVLRRRVVRLLEIVESLPRHPSKMLTLDPLGLLVAWSEVLLESILLLCKARLGPLRNFAFGHVSFGREQGLYLAGMCHGVVIFIHHLVFLDSRLVTLLTGFSRSSFLPPPWYYFTGIDLFFICA